LWRGCWLFGGCVKLIVENTIAIIDQPGIGFVLWCKMKIASYRLANSPESLLFSQVANNIHISGKTKTGLLGKQRR
jgi:hypothetical protein